MIVENWNSGSFDRPWSRVRDTTAILRGALAGEKVGSKLDTLMVNGLRPMNEAWAQGERREATRLVPRQVVDDLVIVGSPADCRAAIDRSDPSVPARPCAGPGRAYSSIGSF